MQASYEYLVCAVKLQMLALSSDIFYRIHTSFTDKQVLILLMFRFSEN